MYRVKTNIVTRLLLSQKLLLMHIIMCIYSSLYDKRDLVTMFVLTLYITLYALYAPL